MHAGSPDRIWAKHRKRKGPGAIAEPIFRLARPAWSARSSATGRRQPGKAGKGPLPKLPGRVLYRAAADRRNTTRATIRESSRHSYRAGRSSTTARLQKTDNACGRQCTPRMAPALTLALYPGSVPVLFRSPDRRLGLRWPASAAAGRSFQDRSVRQNRSGRASSARGAAGAMAV